MSDKFRRIGAMIGVLLLLGIYVVTLVSAALQKDSTSGLFVASLYCTFVVPVWIFVLQAIYNRTHKDAVGKAEVSAMKKTSETEEPLQEGKEAGLTEEMVTEEAVQSEE